MGRLRLKNPTAPVPSIDESNSVLVEVSIKAPAPHLDGIYSYKAKADEISVGHAVIVPFGSGEIEGFVVGIEQLEHSDSRLKRVTKVIESRPLFDLRSLERYRRIANLYGASLFSILSLAASSAKRGRGKSPHPSASKNEIKSSAIDRAYLQRIFGKNWSRPEGINLVTPAGVLWERIAVSLFLADVVPTLILVPTERQLQRLSQTIRDRGIESFVVISSSSPESERAQKHQHILNDPPRLLVGTRGAALAPFDAKRVIIVDPGDENYRERRSPYFRADEPVIWQDALELVTLAHGRNLASLARRENFLMGRSTGRYSFESTAADVLIPALQSRIKKLDRPVTVLVSYNDKSYGSALICRDCRNRALCECGFGIQITKRKGTPSCTRCLKMYEAFECRFCSGRQLQATRMGGEGIGASIGKSIKGSRVIISSADAAKDEVVSGSSHLIVLATQGIEPRVVDAEGRNHGYDIIVIIGANVALNSPSLSRSDRFRRGLVRLLGLINPKDGYFLLDLDASHPDFQELRGAGTGRGLEQVLQERKELHLPPYSTLIELRGDDRVLQRLRSGLLADPLFQAEDNRIFPPYGGSMMLKVDSVYRSEAIKLLREISRVRSAKRLPLVTHRVDPDEV